MQYAQYQVAIQVLQGIILIIFLFLFYCACLIALQPEKYNIFIQFSQNIGTWITTLPWFIN